jgi:hypothetical protein
MGDVEQAPVTWRVGEVMCTEMAGVQAKREGKLPGRSVRVEGPAAVCVGAARPAEGGCHCEAE